MSEARNGPITGWLVEGQYQNMNLSTHTPRLYKKPIAISEG